jgi:hypothetical protein
MAKLITEMVHCQVITEGTGTAKKYFLEGINLQGEIPNKNNRKYPMKILDREVNRYIKEYVNENRALGELGHPENPSINLDKVSHKFQWLKKDGNNYIGRALVLDTPNGKITKALMDAEVKLGMSTRGTGSLRNIGGINEVQEDFTLNTAGDIVADPSAPDAFVNGIMEGVEWIWNNGVYSIERAEQTKKEILKASSNRLEETCLNAWASFLTEIYKPKNSKK